jgi:hypothetical protein
VRVDELQPGQRHRHRVDREVAAGQVTGQGVPERHDRLAGGRVVDLGPVRRDLDDEPALAAADRAEVLADLPARVGPRADQVERLVRPGIRRQVQVHRVAADQPPEHRIADGTPDEGELVAARGEPLAKLRGDGRERHQVADGPATQSLHHGALLGGVLRRVVGHVGQACQTR